MGETKSEYKTSDGKYQLSRRRKKIILGWS